jgi:hypothetical protein
MAERVSGRRYGALMPDTYEAVLDELLTMRATLTQLRFKDTHKEVMPPAHGWFMRVNRSASGVLLMEQFDLDEEAAPLRRSIIEHVVGLKWLAIEGNAAYTYVKRAHAKDTKRSKAALLDAGWTTPDYAVFDEVIEDIAKTDNFKSDDDLLHFAHRCRKYDAADCLAAWMRETPRCHATWESAAPYVNVEDRKAFLHPKPTGRNSVAFVAMHLLIAFAALHDMTENSPWESMLISLNQRIRDLDNAVRHERGMPEIPFDG